MAQEQKSEIISHDAYIEKMQAFGHLSNRKGICYGYAMAAAKALLLTFHGIRPEAWDEFQQRLALIRVIPLEMFKKDLRYVDLRIDNLRLGERLQKDTLYVNRTAEGNLAYCSLNTADQEVRGLIHVGIENGKYAYSALDLDPQDTVPKGALLSPFNSAALKVLEEHQHLQSILKITSERGHTQNVISLSSLPPRVRHKVRTLLKAHPLIQKVLPENWKGDKIYIPADIWNAIRTDIWASFDRTDLVQQTPEYAEEYPGLFPPKASPKTQGLDATSLVSSLATEKNEAGPLTSTDGFLGIYTKKGLAACFALLARVAKKRKESVVLTLQYSEHEITVAYDYAKKRWILMEANKTSGRVMDENQYEKIAKEIFSSFSEGEIVVLEIDVMTLGKKPYLLR